MISTSPDKISTPIDTFQPLPKNSQRSPKNYTSSPKKPQPLPKKSLPPPEIFQPPHPRNFLNSPPQKKNNYNPTENFSPLQIY